MGPKGLHVRKNGALVLHKVFSLYPHFSTDTSNGMTTTKIDYWTLYLSHLIPARSQPTFHSFPSREAGIDYLVEKGVVTKTDVLKALI